MADARFGLGVLVDTVQRDPNEMMTLDRFMLKLHGPYPEQHASIQPHYDSMLSGLSHYAGSPRVWELTVENGLVMIERSWREWGEICDALAHRMIADHRDDIDFDDTPSGDHGN
jgi:hypothetical protein